MLAINYNNNTVSFDTTVSGRYWLVDCSSDVNVDQDAGLRAATDLYGEMSAVPFVAKFVVFGKRKDESRGHLRVFCMTDDKMDKTLENQEHFYEIARSRDVEVWITMSSR